MRVALFGGTFDPIHYGHLRLAAAAANSFALDRVLFAPVGLQPLKPDGSTASFSDRLAMTELALSPEKSPEGSPDGHAGQPPPAAAPPSAPPLSECAGSNSTPFHPTPFDPRFAVSRLDAPHPDGSPNYTVDSLVRFAQEFPNASLFAIAGADSFLDLRRWRSPDRLLELAEWIVVNRPAFPLTEVHLARLALTPTQRDRVHLLTTVHEDVSATELRLRLEAGDPCPGLLPPQVATYIHTHHLYVLR